MEAQKHTRAPWTVAIYEPTPTMLERLKFKQVAVCENYNPAEPKGMLVAMCGDIDPEEPGNTTQSFRDAYLIAAAPDLLEACKRVLQEMEVMNEITIGCEEDLVAAVSKAEGRSPESTRLTCIECKQPVPIRSSGFYCEKCDPVVQQRLKGRTQ